MAGDPFLVKLAQDDRSRKLSGAESVLARLQEFKECLSEADCPDWVKPLEGRLRWYLKQANGDSGFQVFKTVMQLNPRIAARSWGDSSRLPPAVIVFDEVFMECYHASRVPQLFEDLIVQLEAIIASGEVDSIRTIRELERLIATIRTNTRDDFFSASMLWQFTRTYCKNLSLEVLESIPVVKQTVKALRRSLDELDVEMNQVTASILAKVRESAEVAPLRLGNSQRALPGATDELDAEGAR